MTVNELNKYMQDNAELFRLTFAKLGYPRALISPAALNYIYNEKPKEFSKALVEVASTLGYKGVFTLSFTSGFTGEDVGPTLPDGSFSTGGNPNGTTGKDKDKNKNTGNAADIITAVGSGVGSILDGIFPKPITNNITNNTTEKSGGVSTTTLILIIVGVLVLAVGGYFLLKK